MKTSLALSVVLLAFGATTSAQTLGGGSSTVTGSAGPDGTKNASTELERCDAPKGTVAVVEPQSYMLTSLSRYGLQSPVSLIRLMIQQSNCFQVVERGAGMNNMMQERSLAQSGELQADQNIGKGQMVAADFVLTPGVVFSDNNAGGIGGAVGGLLGRLPGGAVLGSVAGGVKFKEAQTSMLLADARSSLQVAAAEGSARKTDFSIGGFGWIPGGWGSGGGYTSTAEGKVIAASLLDNWNNIVRSLRNSPSLIQAKAGVASQANAAGSVEANAAKAGDIMVAKIAGAKVLKSPADGSGELMSLAKTDEVLILGEEKNGYVKVTSPSGDGWVRKVMLKKP